MDVTIQINDPVLQTTEYFLVRYRLLPNGVWVDVGIQSNASFVISGLSDGDYELEVRFVNEEGVVCPAVTRPFTVSEDPPPDECLCPEISELYIIRKCDDTSLIHIAFSSMGNGICQFDVTYTQWGGGAPQTISYTPNTLPPFIDITIPNNSSAIAPTVTTLLSCCDGTTKSCEGGQIVDVRVQDCGCEIPYISGGWINYDPATGIYTLCINFTSANVSHTITAIQQSTTNPAVFDEVITNTVTDGYFEIVIAPEAATDIQYYVLVENECGSNYIYVDIYKCKDNINFQGGETYPTSMTVQINPNLSQFLNVDPASIPDRFVVEIGGVVVLDTGYIGNVSYQTDLNAALALLGQPPSTITAAIGAQSFGFTNPSLATYAQLKVYAPLTNTNWTASMDCTVTEDPKVITLIVENTANSNVQTTQVHGTYAIVGSTINFSPFQNPTETDTFINQVGWVGNPTGGVYLKPILADGQLRRYTVEVLKNGISQQINNYAFGGTSLFHMPSTPTGVVNGDTIRIKISSQIL